MNAGDDPHLTATLIVVGACCATIGFLLGLWAF